MGIYLNPNNDQWQRMATDELYVDKTLLIRSMNNLLNKENCNVCFSRPRRFGKTVDANMLVAYYSKGCDSKHLFDGMLISQNPGYLDHLNKHNVIHLNMQRFLSRTKSIDGMLEYLNSKVISELSKIYDVESQMNYLPDYMEELYSHYSDKFVFILDEWDCIFREYKQDIEAQKAYLDYLRDLFKNQPYVELCYMTGILPIKKYGTHSALNMFDEISMTDPGNYEEFMGFTEEEVISLCHKYDVDFATLQEWYNGYHLKKGMSIYSPRSVSAAISNNDFQNYWSQTETFEALRVYINLNYDGLKDDILKMLVGERIDIDISSFSNDMVSFKSKDDVFTLLIHLGYLGYDAIHKQVYIPNKEVKETFVTSIKNSDWDIISQLIKKSQNLLEATWNMDCETVASIIQNVHLQTPVIAYNSELSLTYTMLTAYLTAEAYYTISKEFPTGKGYADLVFIPKGNKPAMIIELKFKKSVEAGINQIKERNYPDNLKHYVDNLLLVSINYDEEKEHECFIEKYKA